MSVTEPDVYDLINIMDPNKATCSDGISPRLLNAADYDIVPPLTSV